MHNILNAYVSEEKFVYAHPPPMHKKCIKVNGADQPHTETGELQNSNRDVAKSVRFRNERTRLPAKCVIY